MKQWMSLFALGALLASGPLLAGGPDCNARWVGLSGGGSGGWLGVVIMHNQEKEEGGQAVSETRILHVLDGSPAEKAGLHAGDVIVSVDGETVHEVTDLTDRLKAAKPGDSVTITVNRDGRDVTATAVLGDRPSGDQLMRKIIIRKDGDGKDVEVLDLDSPDAAGLGMGMAKEVLSGLGCGEGSPCIFKFMDAGGPRLGVRIEPLTQQLADYFHVDGGLLVTEVLPGSSAEKAGLRAGDVLTSVNATEIREPGALRDALRSLDLPATVRLDVVRKGRHISVDADLNAPANEGGDGSVAPSGTPDHPRWIQKEQRVRL